MAGTITGETKRERPKIEQPARTKIRERTSPSYIRKLSHPSPLYYHLHANPEI
jgi:hypothetical protein